MKALKIRDDRYVFVECEDSEIFGIKLISGRWSGVIYQYGTVKFTEDTKSNACMLTFTFHVVDDQGHDLEDDLNFKNHIGSVLQQIIEDRQEEDQLIAQSRNTDTIKPTT